MALPLLNSTSKERDQLLSIDLGSRTTKAVLLQRKGEKFVLSRYTLLDAPIYDKKVSTELLGEHLRNVCQALDSRVKWVTLAVSVNDSFVRHAELPPMPVYDMRQVLKLNSKTYLQQDLPGYVFDCFVIPQNHSTNSAGNPRAASGNAKNKVLVAGAKKQFVDDLESAVRQVGLVPDCVVPSLIGPVNAFEMAVPGIFAKGIVAVVDIGFRSTTICILAEGELMLARVVSIGGDKLTNGLAESLNISYAEAEGIKIGMPGEVQQNLESLILPLGRELRASIDFFEHQNDRTVGQVYVSGASARSEFILQMLQREMMAECFAWNPTSSLQLALEPQQASEIDHVAPQLTVAIGAAMTAF